MLDKNTIAKIKQFVLFSIPMEGKYSCVYCHDKKWVYCYSFKGIKDCFYVLMCNCCGGRIMLSLNDLLGGGFFSTKNQTEECNFLQVQKKHLLGKAIVITIFIVLFCF